MHLRLLLLALLFAVPAQAQDVPLAVREPFDEHQLAVPLPEGVSYRRVVPRPEDVTGHVVGTRHTTPSEVVDYFGAVGQASDRVRVEYRGETHGGRTLLHAIVTSPENMARLDAVRAANARLVEAPSAVTDEDLAGMPAVVFLGYSIHGNEASGTEAALLTLYHLADAAGAEVEEILRNVVVIIDPLLNPDGRSRFTNWVNDNRGAVPVTDPQDREHDEPWPGGRTNHYWFDLNRDWLPVQHPASQGRIALLQSWHPQVLADYHEMGSEATYFFQPGIPSRTNPNTPAFNQELTGRFAEYHARYLDRIGSLYYTKESFDDFYYGKGSTYPDINGAVGILFEQASSRALARETREGVLDFAFTVRNQFTASLSTLRAAVELRMELLRHMRDFYAGASEFARSQPVQAYVLGLEDDRTRAQHLAQLLRRHNVRLHELARDLETEQGRFRAGEAYVVPLDQPQARFIKAVMERTTTFQDSLFYDVSTWTLPLAFGVPYAEVGRLSDAHLGPAVGEVELDGGALVGGRSDYAYLMPWGRYYAPRALYRLQAAGVRPRLLTAPFVATIDGEPRTFERGTVVIPVAQQSLSASDVHALVDEVVAEDHVRVYAAGTGLSVQGPDLGSRGSLVLLPPRIALLTGPGTSSYEAGEVWHLLSERFRIPVSLLDTDAVGRADLDRYDTIVMAGGFYGGLPAAQIESWVRGGGRLVVLGSAVDWAVEHDLIDLEERELDVDSLLHVVPFEQVSDARGAHAIGGSIFEVRLDRTHPVAYGYPERIAVFRDRTTFYEPAEEPGVTVGVYPEDPLLSGYLSAPRSRQAAGAAAIAADRFGRGRVVAIMDNPNFRAFWYGTNGLFLNAIFLSDAI